MPRYLLGGYDPDHLFVQTFTYRIGFDIRHKPILIFDPDHIRQEGGTGLDAGISVESLPALVDDEDAPLGSKVVFTETLSITASTAIPDRAICSLKGIPSLSKVAFNSGSTSSQLFVSFCFGAA